MLPKAKTVYFHVDVNSAFLSWTAIQHLANGETLDLRTVPAVVGGDEESAMAWCWPRAFPPNGTASKPGNRCLWRAANTPI